MLLCAALASAQQTFVEQQQIFLDKIAEQLRNNGKTSCIAPQLATCETDSCDGSGCGTFSTKLTAAKEIYSLFV